MSEMNPTGCLKTIDSNSTFIWEISNFSTYNNLSFNIYSPDLAIEGESLDNEIKWKLNLCSFDNGFMSLCLKASFLGEVTECDISFKYYLWESNKTDTSGFWSRKFAKNVSWSWGQNNFLDKDGDELKNHLSSSKDTLRIDCVIIIPSCDSQLNMHTDLIKSLNNFFLSENLSDVTIEVDNKKLKAHKIILSTRSEVFLAMFNHNMVESNESIIKITDISYDVMKEVLRFIYCGKIENIQMHKNDLLVAADKYNILLLKRICEKAIMKDINVVNACEILRISDSYQCDTLKEHAIEFIIKNMKEVVNTKEFDTMKDPNLLADILRKTSLKHII